MTFHWKTPDDCAIFIERIVLTADAVPERLRAYVGGLAKRAFE